jgi:hypothetical protein
MPQGFADPVLLPLPALLLLHDLLLSILSTLHVTGVTHL